MSDRNHEVLQITSALINELDLRYSTADPQARSTLRSELDKATMTFSEMRCKMLENEIVCTPDDVAKLQLLQAEMHQIEEVSALRQVAARLAGVLVLM
jgi:hypothetical protein